MKTMIVSACLLGEECKWCGGSNLDGRVVSLCAGREVIAVCPETAGGLPVPRKPSELRGGVAVNRDGESVDEAFRLGAERCLAKCAGREISCAVLKSRSPSCGSGFVYDGTFSGTLVPGDGVFAALLKAHGIRVLTEDETALAEEILRREETDEVDHRI
ncbi:MAG: DUF523 domain-containing protein [Clostridia bacterium]|nr:DUF523 domain-containing protein [Clostridia bacterium]